MTPPRRPTLRATVVSFIHGHHIAPAKTVHEETAIQRQFDATPPKADQIHKLVYDLYGLTDDEIRMIEEMAR